MIDNSYDFISSLSGELLLFRTLWNNSNDNMFIVSIDSDGDFISEATNSSLEKTFNLKPNQVDGFKIKDTLDEVTYKLVSDRYRECIALNKPITYDESAIIDETGKRFWNTTILPVVDEDNSVRIFGISREFTKLMNAEIELEKINKTLENQVKERTKELERALLEMEKISITDSLTGIFNRRYFDEIFIKMMNSSKRKNELFCFIVLDVDFFKEYNDTYGHALGDEVLILIASTMKKTLLRADDYCFRLGGEEFGVIFNTKDKNMAVEFANRLKLEIYNLHILHKESKINDYITVSMGLVCKNPNELKDKNKIYNEADKLLYKAKNSGRNMLMYS